MVDTGTRLRTTIRSIVIIGTMLAVGGGVSALFYAMREEPPRHEVHTLPPTVQTVTVLATDVIERFIGYGSARAMQTASVAAEVAGVITQRVGDIRSGSIVEAGQPLIQLDDRPYRRRVEQVEALVAADRAAIEELSAEQVGLQRLIQSAQRETEVARVERARIADLFEQQEATKREFDFADRTHQIARRALLSYQKEQSTIAPRIARFEASIQGRLAEAEFVRLDVERCRIVAPFAGTIETLHVDQGDHVLPGLVVLTLVDASRVEVPVQLPGSVRAGVELGTPCRLEAESLIGVSWEGNVVRIAPTVDSETRTFAAYVEVDNAVQSEPLIPGSFLRAVVDGPSHQARILVPRGAVRDGQVLVAIAGIAHAREVRIERWVEDEAMLVGNITSGDQVIISHLDQLDDGAPVRTAIATAHPTPPHTTASVAAESTP